MRYQKVANRSTTWLLAHPRIFWLFMKGKYDPYLQWPLAKRLQNLIVARSNVHKYRVAVATSRSGIRWDYFIRLKIVFLCWLSIPKLLLSMCINILTRKSYIKAIPAFCDFTIPDSLYFVIHFQASISWIPQPFHDLKKKSEKKNQKFFWNLFWKNFRFSNILDSFLFIYSNCHHMNIKNSYLEMTITRHLISM